jgi:hypothetical protein
MPMSRYLKIDCIKAAFISPKQFLEKSYSKIRFACTYEDTNSVRRALFETKQPIRKINIVNFTCDSISFFIHTYETVELNGNVGTKV